VSAALRKHMDFAVDAAWQAGKLTLGHFQSGVQAESKADFSPVIIADREAETRVRELLAQAYPDDGIARCSSPLVGLKPAIRPSERV
jgi:histidinol-phosphatase